MGRNKKDLIRKRYFRDNSRQADLLNTYAKNRGIRDGEETPWKSLRKEDFEEKENELYTFVNTIKGVFPIVRIVDSSRIINYCGKRFCFFIEN